MVRPVMVLCCKGTACRALTASGGKKSTGNVISRRSITKLSSLCHTPETEATYAEADEPTENFCEGPHDHSG